LKLCECAEQNCTSQVVSREDIVGESTYQILRRSKSFKDGGTASLESNTVECRLDVLPGFFRVVRDRESFYASVFGTETEHAENSVQGTLYQTEHRVMYTLGVSLSEVGSLDIQNSDHCMGDDD
jgi:hypothetical protein